MMLGRQNGQISIFDHMIYEKVIPKNHLLIRISEIFTFNFVYELLNDKYSDIGRNSIDPIIMVKIMLLEYLYNLSDGEVVERIQTDMAFRWFLGLGIDDKVPDDTTISFFRTQRLGKKDIEDIFNKIVSQCIDMKLVKNRRHLIDSTDVAANVNYPSEKQLARRAYDKMIKELKSYDYKLAEELSQELNNQLEDIHNHNGSISTKEYHKIYMRHLQKVYLRTYGQLQENDKYHELFSLCYDLATQCIEESKDKIVSIVDTEARVAHKSRNNVKRGYKDHIIVDEDSEIILASETTPFNINDELKMKDLITKAKEEFNLKAKEISADKAYGNIENRIFLNEQGIISNIAFYEKKKENLYYGKKDFEIDPDGMYIICPGGKRTDEYTIYIDKQKKNQKYKRFKFDKEDCDVCPLRGQCLIQKDGKFTQKARPIFIEERYDIIAKDMARTETEAFKAAYKRRYIVERRFATMVRNHGLRRCRYIGLEGATKHNICANMASNIIRTIKLLEETA